MTFRRLALISLTASGILLLGGCGGGGGGGVNIPTASNAAITPPPTDPVPISTGLGTEETNQRIASAAFQAVDGAGLQTVGAGPGVVGAKTEGTSAETARLTIGQIVRRHAEKIKDHRGSASVTGAQFVQTVPCFVSGTHTFVFDDVSGNASEIFVNCDEGGVIFHGTLSSTGVSANVLLGDVVGEPYTISVTATITIDLSITITSSAEVLVSQGSFSFSVTFSGTMEDDLAGGVVPGFPTRVTTQIVGSSLLASDGVNTEQLSNFDLTVVDDDATGTTIDGHFTYANSAIGGAVTVNITTPIHYASGAFHPDDGVIEIKSSVSPGMIRVTFSSGLTPVTVEVYSDTAGTNLTATYTLTWEQFEAFV